ncbi:MAG: PAS domain S-box protein, partial [Desulfobacterota bacterium]|nr:PAS domain S-box protein [Thermodesulfobacteriota bacterium]
LEILAGTAALAISCASRQQIAWRTATGPREWVDPAMDLQDRFWVSEALRLSEERFRLITENMCDLLCYTDTEGRYLYLTPSYKRILGYDPLDLLGELIFQRVHPEDLEHVVGEFQSAVASRRLGQAELRYRHADGRYIWIHSTGTVITNDQGEPVGTVVNSRDITERKGAEQARQESEEKYRTLVESIQDGVFLVQNARIRFANGACAEMIGWSPEEIVGVDFRELVAPEDRAMVEDFHRRRLLGEAVPKEYELKMIHRDGVTRVMVNLSVGMTIFQGEQAVIGTIKDITEKKQAEGERRKLEDQVRHVQKLESLAVLAGGIAHDINNLLMGMLGNTELGLLSLPQDDRVRNNLQEIQKAVLRAAELCRQMLAYSGRGQFLIERVQLTDMIKEMSSTTQVSVPKQVQLLYHLAEGLPAVEGDLVQLRQVLMNLVVNASESIGDAPGTITVSTRAMECTQDDFRNSYLNESIPGGLYVCMEVADTGCGMDEATRQKVFDPFFSTKFTGRGLGLAAVLGIVRGHKGAIEVRSEPGRGSTFKVLLPAVVEESDRRTARPFAPMITDVGSKTLLVVDDEEPVRTVATQMLEMLGFRVLTAGDGVEAIEVMRANRHGIDLVLLDLAMPRMSGEETFHAMKAIDRSIPVIITSGYSEEEVESHFSGVELAGMIPKPFSFQTLRDVLGRVLEKEEGN